MSKPLTYKDLELCRQKARNLDEALEYLQGNIDSERLATVEHILRKGLLNRMYEEENP